jgi:hypothetical protein
MSASTKLAPRPKLPAPPHVRTVELARDKILVGFAPVPRAEFGAPLGAERAGQDDPLTRARGIAAAPGALIGE